jgi:hypothetical protein
MIKRRFLALSTAVLTIALVRLSTQLQDYAAAEKLPMRLTDQEFWKLSSDTSEPGGSFHSENLVSNEIRFQTIVPALAEAAVPGRAYLGVGSEQNFTYIAATRPSIAIIIDIRRGNLDLHLIYKALFEMSANRLDFVSRVFSREKPAGLTATSTPNEIFTAFRKAPPSKALYDQNLKEIKAALQTKHGFPLSNDDLKGIDFVYSNWFQYGPDIRYELTTGGGGNFPTYAELMMGSDNAGRNRSYLASEDNFRIVKDLQTRNMIVPAVGNFGGPKAIRAVAAWLKQKETIVSTFYTSNVEQYLRQDGIFGNFCASTSTLPLDAKSVFVRSARAGFAGQPEVVGAGGNFNLEVKPMKPDLVSCPAAR